jgi:trehalose 6-phosphate synthase
VPPRPRRPPPRPLVVAANRLPFRFDAAAGCVPSPGGMAGLVLEAIADRPATWVGSTPDTVDLDLGLERAGPHLVGVPLREDDTAGYYDGCANQTLWPLYHDLAVTPRYEPAWWDAYRRVNARFARAVAAAAAPGGIAWLHDYHLQLVPGLLRRARPDIRIGVFLHVPFPPPELFAQLPWRAELAGALAAADVIGVQDRTSAVHLGAVLTRFGRRGDGHRPGVRTLPVPAALGRLGAAVGDGVAADERARLLRRTEAGDPAVLVLGVDRLDYAKGIDLRLDGLGEAFRRGLLDPARTTLVQIAPPTRVGAPPFRQHATEVRHLAAALNETFGAPDRPVVRLLEREVPTEELVAWYRAADVLAVTSRRDGMNLVAKEFLAARPDGTGALVLSEFAGVADVLGDAHVVNPFDRRGVAAALAAAAAPDEGRTARNARMRAAVLAATPTAWADRFLGAVRPLSPSS